MPTCPVVVAPAATKDHFQYQLVHNNRSATNIFIKLWSIISAVVNAQHTSYDYTSYYCASNEGLSDCYSNDISGVKSWCNIKLQQEGEQQLIASSQSGRM